MEKTGCKEEDRGSCELMSKFLTNLNVELKEDSRVWRVTFPLVYASDLIGQVLVPEGFETDFASVPRIPLIYSMWGDRAHREAVLHDYLFRSDSVPKTSFDVANEVFLEAMAACGKSWCVRYPMYWGVCLGARSYFHQYKVGDSIGTIQKPLPVGGLPSMEDRGEEI